MTPDGVISEGKYSGCPLWMVPSFDLEWFLMHFTWTADPEIRRAVRWEVKQRERAAKVQEAQPP